MEAYFLIVRSVTQAQRMQRLFRQAGIRGEVFRTPMELTDGRGCTYTVQIAPNDLAAALQAMGRMELRPLRIYLRTEEEFREVAP